MPQPQYLGTYTSFLAPPPPHFTSINLESSCLIADFVMSGFLHSPALLLGRVAVLRVMSRSFKVVQTQQPQAMATVSTDAAFFSIT